jgi:hypothetical protein
VPVGIISVDTLALWKVNKHGADNSRDALENKETTRKKESYFNSSDDMWTPQLDIYVFTVKDEKILTLSFQLMMMKF